MTVDVEALYRRHGPMVLRRCRRLLGDETEACDAMHEVFVQVLRRQDQLDAHAPSSLLYRIATNVSLNSIRARGRRPQVQDGELLQRIASLDDLEGSSHARWLLDQLFARQPSSSRTIAVLHLLDGLTLEQVAQTVGLSVSGVRKRLRKLRADLNLINAE